jgi:hypothetical protein
MTIKSIAAAVDGSTSTFVRSDGTALPPSGGGGGGAPTGAEYVVLQLNGSLTHERVLTAGAGISITDGGAGSTVTIVASEAWTYAFLAADHTNSTTTPTAVPGLAFTPAANKRYEIEGRFFVRAAATTTGAQITVVWPTGIAAPSAAHLGSPSSANGLTLGNVTRGTTGGALATGVPSTTLEALGLLTAILTTGASPSGTFRIQLDSEVAASEARMLAGSFIRYREIPTS